MSAFVEDELAEALRVETERRGISQEEAAAIVGTTQQTFGKWLRSVTLPSDPALPKIAVYLNLPVERVLELRGIPRARSSARDRLTMGRRLEALEDQVDGLVGRVERLSALVESRRR